MTDKEDGLMKYIFPLKMRDSVHEWIRMESATVTIKSGKSKSMNSLINELLAEAIEARKQSASESN